MVESKVKIHLFDMLIRYPIHTTTQPAHFIYPLTPPSQPAL